MVRLSLPWLISCLGACAAPAPDDPSSTTEAQDSAAKDSGEHSTGTTEIDTAASDTAVTGSDLWGSTPPKPIPAPQFTATNQAGVTRGADDLMGHPTVLWFFREAGSYG